MSLSESSVRVLASINVSWPLTPTLMPSQSTEITTGAPSSDDGFLASALHTNCDSCTVEMTRVFCSILIFHVSPWNRPPPTPTDGD